MDIKKAQLDMRTAYVGGAGGIFVSGIVWLIAGIIAFFINAQTSIFTFFLGGMFIHPLGIVLSKAFNRSGKHNKNNPLANLALESTCLLFIGLFIAYATFQVRPHWFFSIMLLIIGGRYALFSTLYGMRLYWLLGFILVIGGIGSLLFNTPIYVGAMFGGIIEIIFALLIFRAEKQFNIVKT